LGRTHLDKAAVYESRTETIRTGAGRHVRVRDLHAALMAVNPYNLRRIATIAGISKGMNDPMEAGHDESVRDIVDLVRAMPQYCVPVIEAGRSIEKIAEHFEDLLRDRRFGVSAVPDREGFAAQRSDRMLEGTTERASAKPRGAPTRRPTHGWHDKLGQFFWETRDQDGEFSYFLRQDHKVLTLKGHQRLSSKKPYEECFLVLRTAQGRYFLRWPTMSPQEPAWYLDGDGNAQWFYPAEDDFEELFPGFTYEVFGLQFGVPNIGTDYRRWIDEVEAEAPSLGRDEEEAVRADPGAPGRLAALLEVLEAADLEITTAKALSKHFRTISNRYHPLKHLHATPEEKEQINARYLELTNAYNELKRYYD
jgi:hypothetical protein